MKKKYQVEQVGKVVEEEPWNDTRKRVRAVIAAKNSSKRNREEIVLNTECDERQPQ